MLKYKENFQKKNCYIKSMGDFNKTFPKPSLSGCDLTYLKNNKTLLKTISKDIFKGIDLSNANLTGVDLSELNLTGTILINANLTGANLTGADLTGADLTSTILKKANLKNTILPNGTLINTDLTEVNLSGRDFTNYAFTNVNLTNANLNGANLTRLSIVLSNLTGANLIGAIFNNTFLSGVNLTNANLSNIKIEGNIGIINGTNYLNKLNTLTRVKLPQNYKNINGYIFGPRIKFSAKYNQIYLTNIDLSNMDLSYSYFDDVNVIILNGANLTKTKLNSVILTNADLTGANLTEADLTGAILNNTNLTGANLTGADLSGIIIQTSEINGTKYTIGKFDHINKYYRGGIISGQITEDKSKGVKLPPNYKILNGYILGPMITLIGTPDKLINLTNIDLTNMDLSKSYINNVDFTNTLLGSIDNKTVGVNFSYSFIFGTDFTKAKAFDQTQLHYVDLSYATLQSVIMNNLVLSRVKSINNTTFLNSNCKDITYIEYSASLSPNRGILTNIIFDSCDLSNARFSVSFNNVGFINGTKLNNAKFEGTNTLININFSNAILTGTTFTKIQFDNGVNNNNPPSLKDTCVALTNKTSQCINIDIDTDIGTDTKKSCYYNYSCV